MLVRSRGFLQGLEMGLDKNNLLSSLEHDLIWEISGVNLCYSPIQCIICSGIVYFMIDCPLRHK